LTSYYGLSFHQIRWNGEPWNSAFDFDWDERSEIQRLDEIVDLLVAKIPDYQFKLATNVEVVVPYSLDNRPAQFIGKLDIISLQPNVLADIPHAILSQCICVIEIKKGLVQSNHVNQLCLQLIAINSGGNRQKPFGLLTNMTDTWLFMWISLDNIIKFFIVTNHQSGLAALKEGLDMMGGLANNCPFAERGQINFPDIGGSNGGNDEIIADLSEFYDEMAPEEIQTHKQKVKFTRFFQIMSPSLRSILSQYGQVAD